MKGKMQNYEFGVSYFSNRFKKHLITDLKALKKDGFTSILHTFSEEDFLFNPETIKELVNLSKDYGFSVWIDPWGFGKAFGGEALSRFLLDNYDAWQVLSNNKKIPVACLNNPKFYDYMTKWIDTVLQMDIDYIFWDEPHFAITDWNKLINEKNTAIWGCRCDICQKKYKEMYNKEMPYDLTKEVAEFRSISIMNFLKKLSSYAKKNARKKIKISICLISADNPYLRSASFEDMAKIKEVDGLGVDPYWFWIKEFTKKSINVYEHNYKFAKHVFDVCSKYGKEPHFWLQGFKIKKGEEYELVQAINAARDAGVKSLWVWGYDGCSMMSSLKSDEPEKTWKTIVKEFKKIKNNL
jgi:hypothetical protein